VCVCVCGSATSVRLFIYWSKTTVSTASVHGMIWYSVFMNIHCCCRLFTFTQLPCQCALAELVTFQCVWSETVVKYIFPYSIFRYCLFIFYYCLLWCIWCRAISTPVKIQVYCTGWKECLVLVGCSNVVFISRSWSQTGLTSTW